MVTSALAPSALAIEDKAPRPERPARAGKRARAPLLFRLCRLVLRVLLRLLFRVRVEGLENIPEGSYILAANHLGWLDPFILLAVFPAEPRLHILGDRDAMFNRRWKRVIIETVGGVIPVRRNGQARDLAAARAVHQTLGEGGVFMLFPEGQVGAEEGVLLPLRKGVSHFARRGGRAILPVTLNGLHEFYWRKPMTVVIGEPIAVAPGKVASDADHAALLERLAATLWRGFRPIADLPEHKRRLRFLTRML